MAEEELTPIVYEKFAEPRQANLETWPEQISNMTGYSDFNTTAVDDVFGWGSKYGETNWPPVFPRLPIDYNTVLNQTAMQYGRTSLYLLAKADTALSTPENRYTLCQVQTSITALCSTRYSANDNGGALSAQCSDPPDDLAFISTDPKAMLGSASLSADWPYMAAEWANSLSLNAGVNNANASNARLLSQFILQEPALNASMPSTAEALAVLAGCTALESARGTPFLQYWNYSLPTADHNIFAHPRPETFAAQLHTQEYASGGVYPWQRAFYPVLFLLFLSNLGCLAYFVSHSGLVTDFSEPQNLFALAINSPPSQAMAGSCGAGPNGNQYKVSWVVMEEREHLFVVGGSDAGTNKPLSMAKSFSNLRRRVHGGVSPLLPPRLRLSPSAPSSRAGSLTQDYASAGGKLPTVQWAEMRSPMYPSSSSAGPSTAGMTTGITTTVSSGRSTPTPRSAPGSTPASAGGQGMTHTGTWGENSLGRAPTSSTLSVASPPIAREGNRSPISRMYSVFSKRTSVL
jgi:hypothetical protein